MCIADGTMPCNHIFNHYLPLHVGHLLVDKYRFKMRSGFPSELTLVSHSLKRAIICYTQDPSTSRLRPDRRLVNNRQLSYVALTSQRARHVPPFAATRGMAGSASPTAEFGEKYVTKGVARIANGVIAHGKGSYVTFEDGRQMLDFTCGIGVTNLGMFF